MIKIALVNVFGGLIFGWTVVGVNAAVGVLWRCWYGLEADSSENSWLMAILQAIINVGAGIGALSGGAVADKLGRKKAIGVSGLLAATAILSTVTSKYGAQIFIRIVSGLGVGLASSACNSYVSEMAPKQSRGFYGALFQVFITFGILIANVVGYIALGEYRDYDAETYCALTEHSAVVGRNAAVMLPGGILALCLFGLAFIIPESHGGGNTEERHTLTDKINDSDEPDSGSYFRPVFTGVMMAVALQLTGINAVMFYAPKFFEAAGVKQVMLGTVIIMAWNFVTTLASPQLSDRLGRRVLLVPSLYLLSLAILLMDPIYSNTSGNTKGTLGFVLLGLYILGFEAGPGCLFWVICNELFPDAISNKAFSGLNALQWVLTTTVTLIFPPLQKAVSNHVFLLFGIPGLLVATFLLLCLPETRGRTKEDITEEMSTGSWIVFGKGRNSGDRARIASGL